MRTSVNCLDLLGAEELQTLESQRQMPPLVAQIFDAVRFHEDDGVLLTKPYGPSNAPRGVRPGNLVAGGESHRTQQRGKGQPVKIRGPCIMPAHEAADSIPLRDQFNDSGKCRG